MDRTLRQLLASLGLGTCGLLSLAGCNQADTPAPETAAVESLEPAPRKIAEALVPTAEFLPQQTLMEPARLVVADLPQDTAINGPLFAYPMTNGGAVFESLPPVLEETPTQRPWINTPSIPQAAKNFAPLPPVQKNETTSSRPLANFNQTLSSQPGHSLANDELRPQIGPYGVPSTPGFTNRSTPPVAVPAHNAELDTARRQVDETLRAGFALADRGALYSAHSEFIRALREMAQALDTTAGSRMHLEALAAGIRASQEAEDFQPKGDRVETQLPLDVLVASHQTPVFKQSVGEISPRQAYQLYQDFAQQKLAQALEHEPLGSLTLYALAKTQTALDSKQAADAHANISLAMTYHRAALDVESNNFLAANDLGVLLAKQGRWEEARVVLQNSVTISPQSATMQNLALVHQNLREFDLARQAQQRAQQLALQEQRGPGHGGVNVQWLDPTTFSHTIATGSFDTPVPPAQTAQRTGPSAGSAKSGGPSRN